MKLRPPIPRELPIQEVINSILRGIAKVIEDKEDYHLKEILKLNFELYGGVESIAKYQGELLFSTKLKLRDYAFLLLDLKEIQGEAFEKYQSVIHFKNQGIQDINALRKLLNYVAIKANETNYPIPVFIDVVEDEALEFCNPDLRLNFCIKNNELLKKIDKSNLVDFVETMQRVLNDSDIVNTKKQIIKLCNFYKMFKHYATN